MNDKNPSKTSAKKEDMDTKQNRKADGKKMVKQSLLILLVLVSAAVVFSFVEGVSNHLGVELSSIVADSFFSIWAIAAVFAMIGLYIGSVLWFDLKSDPNQKIGGRVSILDPRNPAGPNYIHRRY